MEDFLTEALADLLNRLPETVHREFIAIFMGGSPEGALALERIWPRGASTHWVTQRVIDGGLRLDLLFEIDGKPMMVVENKIAANFQMHGGSISHGQHQLTTYGRWLEKQTGPEWGGALVLLTHQTPAPENFLSSDSAYGGRYRSVVRWADLARWLGTLVRNEPEANLCWVQLAYELVTFLKERDLDSELAASQDIAALQIYIASADRVRNSIEQVWESARSMWRPICQQTDYPLEISSAYGCIWKYRYLSKSDFRDCYLAVGIRYPGMSNHASYLEPHGEPYLFVEVGSEQDESSINAWTFTDVWVEEPNMRLAKRLLRYLSADPDMFVAESMAWVNERIAEVVQRLS